MNSNRKGGINKHIIGMTNNKLKVKNHPSLNWANLYFVLYQNFPLLGLRFKFF